MLNYAMMMMMNCFCRMVDRRKVFSLISSRSHSLSEILTIANLQHAAIRVWACAEPEFRLSWMKLCSSDNHYTTALVTRVRANNYGFRGKMCGDHDTAIFTMLYLKVLLTVWFHKIFKFFLSSHTGLKHCMLNIGEK